MSQQRRQEILMILGTGKKVKGEQLAQQYNVTRQVIVKDIALLRAEGHQIVSTPRGYYIHQDSDKHIFVLKSNHLPTREAMEAELHCIIAHGGSIIDVIIEHQVYHEIRIVLDLQTQCDIDKLMLKFKESGNEPLLVLTNGVHYHTIAVDRTEQEQAIIKALEKIPNFKIVEILDK